jgi:hypothetical protein
MTNELASLSASNTHLGPKTSFYYCQTGVVLLMWGAHSDERVCVSFTVAGPHQRSHIYTACEL